MSTKPTRIVICDDSINWLQNKKNLESIVTSIPDMNEVNLSHNDYIKFLRLAAKLCLLAVSETGYIVFLQTDRKHNGIIDKSYYITDEAYKLNYKMIWHKIALRTGVGKTDLYRPTYSHMLCYSHKGKIGKAIPDVIERGQVTYTNGFGIDAVRLVIKYLKDNNIKTVYDVFVGSGTTLAIANEMGLNAIGIDIDPEQCEIAKHQ